MNDNANEERHTPNQTAQPGRKEKQGGRPRQKINAQAAWERLQGGESLRRIARRLGVDHHTLWDHLRKAGFPTTVEGAPEISTTPIAAPSAISSPLPSVPAPPYFATVNGAAEGLGLIPPGTKWIFLVCGKWNQQCTASYQPYCTAVSIDQWHDEYENLPVFCDAERIFVLVSFDLDNPEIALEKQSEAYAQWLDSIARAPRAIVEKCVVSRVLSGQGARPIGRAVLLQAREGRSMDSIAKSIATRFEPLPHWRDVEKMKELSAAPVIENPGHARFGDRAESWRIGRFPHI